MAKPEVLTIPTFKHIVYLARDQDQFEWICKKYNTPSKNFITTDTYATTHNLLGCSVVVVSMRKRRLTPYEAAIAAHEATHVKQFILENVGEYKIGHETEAYLVEQITNFILSN